VKLTVPKSIPVKGQKLYSDPWDVNVREVSRYHEETERRKAEEWKAGQYQQQLKALPQVDYYPTTKLKELQYKKQLAKIENELEKMQSGTTTGGEGRDEDEEMEEYSQTIAPSALNHLGFSEEFQAKTAESQPRSSNSARGVADNDQEEEENDDNVVSNNKSGSHPNSFYKYASRQTIQEEEERGEGEEEEQELEQRGKEQQPSSSSLRLDHLQPQQPNYLASPSSTLSLFSSASQQQKANRRMKKTVIKFGQPTAVKDTSSVLSLHAVKTIPIPSSSSASQKNNNNSSSSSYLEKLEKEYPAWSNNEFENKKLLSLAKQGDQQILYEQNIAKYLEEYQMTSRLKNSSATLQLMPDPIVPSARVPSRQSSPKGGSRQRSPMSSAMNSPSFNHQQSQQQQQSKMNYYYYNEAEEEEEQEEIE
jgi:hypothetical protein